MAARQGKEQRLRAISSFDKAAGGEEERARIQHPYFH
jgi:hypothetical protein